jgi:hypothetical protein
VKMMHGLKYILLAAIGAVALSGTTTRAQQQEPTDTQQGQQPAAPIPAIRSPLAGATGDADVDDSQVLTPDTRSLTGAEDL